MQNLLDIILKQDNNFTIITPYEVLNKEYFKSLQVKNKNALQSLKNTSVNIQTDSNLELAKLFILLDGIVGDMLFLPQDIDANLHKRYLAQKEVSHEVYLEDDTLHVKQISSPKKTDETQWIIPTSGTTNEPKLITHTLKTLTKTVQNDTAKGKDFNFGLCYDLHRFAGLQVFLQAIYGGSKLTISGELTLPNMLILFAQKKCNILSATPSFFRKILMYKEADNLNLKRVTLGGEIADSKILQTLKLKFKNAKITHIYASTEAGVGFSVKDEKAGFPLSFLQTYNLNIIDKTLWIKTEHKHINTHDLVETKGDRVYFLGRDSGAINVGGNKVQPEEVEMAILELEFINGVKVYAKKSPITGFLVCADIVLKDNTQKNVLKKEVLEHCKKTLESYKVPALIKVVDGITISKSGKIKRS